MRAKFEGVFEERGRFFTENLIPGNKVYGERLVQRNGKEYRQWDIKRSKLAAAMKLGLKKFPIRKDNKILYLGASQGTTPSHFSDIVKDGIVYCVEIGARNATKLYDVCLERKNMIPIIEDANKPEKYGFDEKIDFIYQDISQREQAKIVIKNTGLLKDRGYLMLAIKARSISQKERLSEIYGREIIELEKKFDIIEKIDIHRFDKEHLFIFARKR